jgi:hypothetical protein
MYILRKYTYRDFFAKASHAQPGQAHPSGNNALSSHVGF